jgi:hypothetical protein
MIHFMYELPGTMTERLKESIKFQRPFSSFCFMPPLHDPGEKTILGQTRAWTGEEVLDLLANHPKTAERISHKMWLFFGSENPGKPEIDRVAAAFRRSHGDIKTTLRALVKSPEFWSEKCVRQLPKNPVDFVIGIARVQGIGRALLAKRDPNATTYTKIAQGIPDNAGYAAYRMDRAGLSLFNPPDVSGWKWGSAFITPAAMAERYQYQGMYLDVPGKPDVASQTVMSRVALSDPPTSEAVAKLICEAYSVVPTPSTVKLLATYVESQGGPKALKDLGHWSGVHFGCMKYLAAAPEMHVS